MTSPFRFSALIIGVLLLQFALVAWTFPLPELWSSHLQSHIDAAYHWYQLKFGVTVAQTGHLLGYDPFFGAGYIRGDSTDPSARLPTVLAILLHPWLNEVNTYKIWSFAAAIIGPVFIPLAVRALKLSFSHIVIATLFGFILWWASYFRWYHTAGMVTFVLVSYATMWYLASLLRCLNESDNWKLALFTGVIGAILFFCHPLFPVPIIFAIFIYGVIRRKQLKENFPIKPILLIGSIALLPNLLLLYSMYHHQGVLAEISGGPYQKAVNVNLIWQWTLGLNGGSKLNIVLALTALWACIWQEDSRECMLARLFTLTGWVLIIFAAVGAAVPGMSFAQPNRFFTVGSLMMTIPAAMGVISMLQLLKQPRQRKLTIAAITSLLFITIVTAYSLNEVRREISYADIGHYGKKPPEVTGLGDYSQWIIEWLKRNTTTAGRVLFEVSMGRIHDNANIIGYYAYTSDREFIGGSISFHLFASFQDGRFFRKPINDFSQINFQKYLDFYNIGWIIAHSDVSKKYLETVPGVELVDNYKALNAYKVNRPLNFFMEGNGRILERGFNRLLLSELQGNSVTLKYHLLPGMKSEPPVKLEPVKILDDPTPFIKIINPPERVLLYLSLID